MILNVSGYRKNRFSRGMHQIDEKSARALLLILSTFTYLLFGAMIFDKLESEWKPFPHLEFWISGEEDTRVREEIEHITERLRNKYNFSDRYQYQYQNLFLEIFQRHAFIRSHRYQKYPPASRLSMAICRSFLFRNSCDNYSWSVQHKLTDTKGLNDFLQVTVIQHPQQVPESCFVWFLHFSVSQWVWSCSSQLVKGLTRSLPIVCIR